MRTCLCVVLVWLLASSVCSASSSAFQELAQIRRDPCTCEDLSLCEPLKGRTNEKEFLGWMWPKTNNFRQYNWTLLTTVAWQEDPELICTAHKHGVRVVRNAGDLTQGLDLATRADWVIQTVKHIIQSGIDGINFDLEDAAAPESELANAYSDLVALTADTLRAVLPNSQISVAVSWTPFDADGRNYQWARMAESADFLTVMAYDMQAQIWGRCVASANDPLSQVENGLKQWLYYIPPTKLVLAVPWYGYDYKCLNQFDGSTGGFCELEPANFRGAPCSDLVGAQRPLAELLPIMDRAVSDSHMHYDEMQRSPFFNYHSEDGTQHQVWFSDPDSLRLRYSLAAKLGLRGVAAWNLEHLYFQSEAGITSSGASKRELQMRTEMWRAVEAFFEDGGSDNAECAGSTTVI